MLAVDQTVRLNQASQLFVEKLQALNNTLTKIQTSVELFFKDADRWTETDFGLDLRLNLLVSEFTMNRVLFDAFNDKLNRQTKTLERCKRATIDDFDKIKLITGLRPSLLKMLHDDHLTALQEELVTLLQIICFISPLNKIDNEDGSVESILTLSEISDGRVFLSTVGYILSVEDLLHDPQNTLKMINYNSLCEVEKKALAHFQHKFIDTQQPLYFNIAEHPWFKRVAFFAIYLLLLSWEISHCTEDPDYVENLNFASRNLMKVERYLIWNDVNRNFECQKAAALSLKVISASFVLNVIFSQLHRYGLDKLTDRVQQRILTSSEYPKQIELKNCLTDFTFDIQVNKHWILKTMDTFENIANESRPTRRA